MSTNLYLVELQKEQYIGYGKGIRTTAHKRYARSFETEAAAERALNKHKEFGKLGLLDDAKIIPV